MTRFKSLTAVLLLLLFGSAAFAERPKIGLALAGGGAKGSAHIAVLELLEQHQIPVDYIAGTSIGSYVGALYALGYGPKEIRRIIFEADLNRGFSDAIKREKLPHRAKRHRDIFNIPIEIGYRDDEVRLPIGLLFGQTMSTLLRRSVGNIQDLESFDQLPIPFRAIATDLVTSDTVVLDSGDLIKALQASSAVPGVLVPVEIEGRYLVDGGMSQNLPISQVRELGADIVIAVDVSAPLLDKDDLDSGVAVLNQITNFLTVKNLEAQKRQLKPNDVYIRPEIGHLSTTDFAILPEAYEAGKEAALSQLEQLRQFSVDSKTYQLYADEKKIKQNALFNGSQKPLVDVILSNQSSLNEAYLLSVLGIKKGYTVSAAQLTDALDRVYALNRFERVDGSFQESEDGRILNVEVIEKSWGPNVFELGLGWEDDFTLDSTIKLDIAHTWGDITDNNGEWRNEIRLGTDKKFRSEVHLPLDQTHGYYFNTSYQHLRRDQNFFIDNERAITYHLVNRQLDLALGFQAGNLGVLEAGFSFKSGDFSNGILFQDGLEYDSSGIFLRFGYDNLDRFSLPTRGSRLNLQLTLRDESIDGTPILGDQDLDQKYQTIQFHADWKNAQKNGNHVIVTKAAFTYLDSDIDQSIEYAELGGFLNLSGFHKNALIGNHKLFAAVAYQYDLGKSLGGLSDYPVYAGFSLELGNVWPTADNIKLDELIAAGSLFLSTDSVLGPVALAVGFGEEGAESVYFFLGNNM